MKSIVVAVTLILSLLAWSEAVSAQEFSVGIQSPLAAFGRIDVGPVAVSLGIPLRFNFASIGVWAAAKWMIWTLDLASFETRPYLGGTVQMLLIGEATYLSWSALAGLEISIPETQLKLFGQLGLDPNFSTGLLESLTLGVGYYF